MYNYDRSRVCGSQFTAMAALLSAATLTASTGAHASTGVQTESVNDYSTCNGSGCSNPPCYGNPSLSNSNSSAAAFWSQLSSSNDFGFTQASNWTDSNTWDTDFLDPDISGSSVYNNDTYNFDQSSLAISYYQGHGLSLGGQTTQTCTSETNCTSPPAGTSTGTSGYGTCAITPPTVSLYGSGKGVCFYAQTPALSVCGSDDHNGHFAALGSDMALGENPTVGSWRGAATNGGTQLAIVHMSWGMTPFFPLTNWEQVFGGLQIYAGVFAPWGDTNDSSTFGNAVAAPYTANPDSAVADDYASAISSVTDGGGCSGSGFSYHGGFNGCGCQMAVTFGVNNTYTYDTIDNEDWQGLQSESTNQESPSYWYYTAYCNYNPSTYPWSGGL